MRYQSEELPIESQGPQHTLFEPVPLGPLGVERVVNSVSLDDSGLRSDETVSSFLAQILGENKSSHCYTLATWNDQPGTNGVQRHRASWTAPSNCLPVHVQPKQRASWTVSSNAADLPAVLADIDGDDSDRFRGYQSMQWKDRFDDLVEFRKHHGHCLVPHNFKDNPSLSQWVKRQRYQYKLKQEGKHTTLTDERQALLDALGFVWDSHGQVWEEKYWSLCQFREEHGHVNVPSKFEDRNLAIWVKCQRRQYKLHMSGQRSAMCKERIDKLEALGFVWNPRRL
eukprot:Nitzschia sp. Nitz4//scaffold202_size38995//33164//34081//NITZ4_007636-RA/size38995-augustus-gene-0.52-mRNA-1//1//CDS//3329541396//3788//frame0